METPTGLWIPRAPDLKRDTSETFMWIAGETESADTAHLAYIAGSWEAEQGKGSEHLFSNGYEIHLKDFKFLDFAEESALFHLPFDTNHPILITYNHYFRLMGTSRQDEMPYKLGYGRIGFTFLQIHAIYNIILLCIT